MRELIMLAGIAALSACSPGYVIRAAYEQGKILANRKPIEAVINDPMTDQEIKTKLELVSAARSYAQEIGLNPGRSFTKYSKVKRDVLAWVLLGSKPDSFTLHTWWFPFVGSVPYKGFFDKKDADEAAKMLEGKGFETWVRGTDAFSTLGWFDDPILSTTLRNDEVAIVDTVIHESVHSTIWIDGHVDFNESLANFVGARGAQEFFLKRVEACKHGEASCLSREKDRLKKCEDSIVAERDLSERMEILYSELTQLYESKLAREEKLGKRVEIFERIIAPLRLKYSEMKVLNSINNAEIMQLKLYLSGFKEFESAFESCAHQIPCLMERVKVLKKRLKSGDNPFTLFANI